MWRLPQHLLLSQALDVGHSPGAATACRPLWPTVKTDSKNHCPGAATACGYTEYVSGKGKHQVRCHWPQQG